ncbi:hypothetical protein C8J55DRAFT_184025 [Lentinula edodes]|uniref:Uncharacterized protein n=1 Tax=Lentinula lateritia TaxID=40482 RepID=A0A9W9A0J3_9AGAR|nr:hypothetical protein C8J55DRAFT_184025 [Lentinula edodes]
MLDSDCNGVELDSPQLQIIMYTPKAAFSLLVIALLLISMLQSSEAGQFHKQTSKPGGSQVPPKTNSRQSRTCSNGGERQYLEGTFGKCGTTKSKGWVSTHNCVGHYYYCVREGQPACYKLNSMTEPLERGECFL